MTDENLNDNASESFTEDVAGTEEVPAGNGEPVKPAKTVPYERFKEVNDELKSLKGKNPQPPASGDEIVKTVNALEGYSKSEREKIMDYASKTNQPVYKAVTDEVIQLAVIAEREKVAREKAIPEPTFSVGESGKSHEELSEIASDAKKHQQLEKEVLARKRAKGI
jgi:hypothetical protein